MTFDDLYLPKCPICMSKNVEPRGTQWWCEDCQKSYDTASVEEAPPLPPIKKRKGGK